MYISTFTGNKFYPREIRIEAVSVVDIAHHLSQMCRFNGATDGFYSVAQHAVLVSRLVPEYLAYAGLHHDSAEAYTGDVISPIKEVFPELREWEKKVEEVVFAALGVEVSHIGKAIIKTADLVALATEKRDLMPYSVESWQMLADHQPIQDIIQPMSPEVAKELFLARHQELLAKQHRQAA